MRFACYLFWPWGCEWIFFVWLIFWLVCLFVGGQIFLCMCVLFGVFFGVFLVWPKEGENKVPEGFKCLSLEAKGSRVWHGR